MRAIYICRVRVRHLVGVQASFCCLIWMGSNSDLPKRQGSGLGERIGLALHELGLEFGSGRGLRVKKLTSEEP